MFDNPTYLYSFSQLGFLIQGYLLRLGLTRGLKEEFAAAIAKSVEENSWFTEQNIRQSLEAIATEMLLPNKLKAWWENNYFGEHTPKKVGIIMAGNIPLVGFHDLLCVLSSGNAAVVKLSSKDPFLLPLLKRQLVKIDYEWEQKIIFADALDASLLDAVIATGSDSSVAFFEAQYKQIPHIFRKSKSSLAVLVGNETTEQLQGLASDVFSYFGLGCRSVSKILVPQNYDFSILKPIFAAFSGVKENKNFADCHRYAKALLLTRQEPFTDWDFVLLKESHEWTPLVAELLFEEYENDADLQEKLQRHRPHLQCLIAATPMPDFEQFCVAFGAAQRPQLHDYADQIDTMKFLFEL